MRNVILSLLVVLPLLIPGVADNDENSQIKEGSTIVAISTLADEPEN